MPEPTPPQTRGQQAKRWLKLGAPLLASIAGLSLLRLLGPDWVTQEQLSGMLKPLGQWAPLVFILFLAVRPVTLLPGQVFTAVGGLLFGTLMGTVYALLGSLGAACLVQLLARKFGPRLMKRLAGGNYPALKEVARENGFFFALLATVNPLVPTDVAVAAAGSSGCRFWPTTLGVMLGTLPGTVLTAQFGSALGQGKTVLTALSAVGMVGSLVFGVIFGRRLVTQLQAATQRLQERRRSHAPA